MADWRQVAGVTVIDNSKEVLQAEGRAVEAALTKIGIAAKRNIQGVILEKNIYDTGDLYRSIDYQVNSAAQSVDVGSPLNYSPYPELGTWKMAARPYVRPGVLDNVGEYKRITEDTFRDA